MGQDPDELFDVVDENDDVIGQATRETVHANGLRHRAVHILLEDTGGCVYLQRRSSTKDTFPGRWDSSCSGHLDTGEDYLTAAVRELEEEVGLEIAAEELREVLRIEAREETGMEFVRVYRCCPQREPEPNPYEISEGRWVGHRELDAWITERPEEFAPALIYLWRQLRHAEEVDAPEG